MSEDSGEPASPSHQFGELDALIEDAPVGVALFDRELRFTRVNARMAEINGLPAAAHLGRRPQELLPAISVAAYLPALQRALSGADTEATEVSGQTPSRPGSTRWWLVSCSPLRGPASEVIGVASFVVEVTARKRAEHALSVVEREGLAHAEAMARLAAASAEVATVPELAGVVANNAPDAVDAVFANVALLLPPGDRLQVFHGEMLDPEINARWRELPITTRTPLSDAITSGTAVFVRSPQENARLYPALVEDTKRAGLEATASIELRDRDGSVLGAIGFGWDAPQQFDGGLRARLDTVVQLATQSIQRAKVYEGERLERERMVLIAEVTAELSEGGPPRARIERLCELLAARFADLVGVELTDRQSPAETALHSSDAATLELLRRLRDCVFGSEAACGGEGSAGSGEAQHVPRITNPSWRKGAPAGSGGPGVELQPCSFIGVPLRAGSRTIGTLLLAHTTSGRSFDGEDFSFARQLGDRVGLLLDNARLSAAEHEIAVELQRQLLPASLPTPSNVLAVARYQPGYAPLAMGGDWYDVVGLPDGGLAIAVGDIVGHGPRAAATMGQLRSAFAALAQGAQGPADLLRSLDTFAARATGARFSSVCAAWLDTTSSVLRYACAGHPPPLILQADGTIETLEGGRSALIGLGGSGRGEAESTLVAGARLLLYTDGLIERRRASIDSGLERLVDAARRHRELELERFCDELLAEMTLDRPALDDVALLCIEMLTQEAAGAGLKARGLLQNAH